MNTQQQIIIRAALHAHQWPAGTDWYDLAADSLAIYQTVQEYSAVLAVPAPERHGLELWLGREDE